MLAKTKPQRGEGWFRVTQLGANTCGPPHLAHFVIYSGRTDPWDEAVLAQKGAGSQNYCQGDFCAGPEGCV